MFILENFENQQQFEEVKKLYAEVIEKSLTEKTLMDDYFFTAFMQNNHACMQIALRAFTQNDSIEVTNVKVQHVVKNGIAGHGVRYDSLVETKDGTVYEMEVENRPDKSLGLRLRYYGAMFNKEHLKKNEGYATLPPFVNIVVMPKDARGQDKPLYFVRRTFVKSQNEVGDDRAFFEDGEMIVLVNALYKNVDSYVGKVIHDFTTPSGEPKLIDEFERSMEVFLRTEEGRRKMTADIIRNTADAEELKNIIEDMKAILQFRQEMEQSHKKVEEFRQEMEQSHKKVEEFRQEMEQKNKELEQSRKEMALWKKKYAELAQQVKKSRGSGR